MKGESTTRMMAACEQCGSVYAARETVAGKILPIGRPNGCACGCSEFAPLKPKAAPSA